jgi:hypothetical protein
MSLFSFPVYVNGTFAIAFYNQNSAVSEISSDYSRRNQLRLRTETISTTVAVNTSLGPFLCHIGLSVREGMSTDIALGRDWFVYCSLVLPTVTLSLSGNMVLDFSLSPAVRIRECLSEFSSP